MNGDSVSYNHPNEDEKNPQFTVEEEKVATGNFRDFEGQTIDVQEFFAKF